MYLFLVERVHVVRCRRYSRKSDRWYILNLGIIILGFGCIAVFAFIDPVADLSSSGVCRIGVPLKITLPLLVYDVTINIYLTAHFVYFARPQTKRWGSKAIFQMCEDPLFDQDTSIQSPRLSPQKENTLKRLARRTLKGMCIVLVGTSVNLTILFYTRGHERDWMCFMICTIDGKIHLEMAKL